MAGPANASRLQNIAGCHFFKRADPFLVVIFASQRIVDERGAIYTKSTLTMFAQTNGWFLGVIKTNPVLFSKFSKIFMQLNLLNRMP